MYEVFIAHEAEKYYNRQDQDTKRRLNKQAKGQVFDLDISLRLLQKRENNQGCHPFALVVILSPSASLRVNSAKNLARDGEIECYNNLTSLNSFTFSKSLLSAVTKGRLKLLASPM